MMFCGSAYYNGILLATGAVRLWPGRNCMYVCTVHRTMEGLRRPLAPGCLVNAKQQLNLKQRELSSGNGNGNGKLEYRDSPQIIIG
jgi:hypothetical protein